MIKYNYLTLPQSVQFRRGDRIEYVYDASGGNKVYVNNQLKYVLTDEGYMEKATGSTTYTTYYYLNDHLGSHWIVMDAYGTVKQVNSYYPSGASMAERRTDQ